MASARDWRSCSRFCASLKAGLLSNHLAARHSAAIPTLLRPPSSSMVARTTAWVNCVTVMTPNRNGRRSLASRSKHSTAASLTLIMAFPPPRADQATLASRAGNALGGVKRSDRPDTQEDKQRQHRQLCNEEWRLRLRRRQRLQESKLLKSLHHTDEDVEVKRDHRADHIDPAPTILQMEDVERQHGERQHDERNDGHHMRWQQARKRKEQAGHTGQNRGEKKNRRPAGQPPCTQHAEDGNDAGRDSDQAQDHVQGRESRQRQANNHRRVSLLPKSTWPGRRILARVVRHNETAQGAREQPRHDPGRRPCLTAPSRAAVGAMPARDFILANTKLLPVPLVPEIALYLAEESLPIWQKTEEELQA